MKKLTIIIATIVFLSGCSIALRKNENGYYKSICIGKNAIVDNGIFMMRVCCADFPDYDECR